jgi:hypothetical protein
MPRVQRSDVPYGRRTQTGDKRSNVTNLSRPVNRRHCRDVRVLQERGCATDGVRERVAA